MKKLLLATVALAALASTASAADMAARPYTKAPMMEASPIYNWTGFYIGGHVGGAFGGSNNILAPGFTGTSSNDGVFMGGAQVYVLEGGYDGTLEVGPPRVLPKPDPAHRYRRPYEGTDVAEQAMQAYLDWEYGLVEQLRRDGTHGFYVI